MSPTAMARKKSGKPKKKGKKGLTAKTADKFRLYEDSVQEPEADVPLIDRVFRKERGRKPLSLREDFCGTAWLCAEWVKSHPERTAVGVDLDEKTLGYGRRRHVDPLGDDASRVDLLREDVLAVRTEPADVAVAFNFSYFGFKDRATLQRYFRNVRRGLKDDGVFFIDIYGGADCQDPIEEETEKEGYSYIWDQDPVDAIQGTYRCAIHFTFPDGSRIKNAFTYDWRFWSLPEVRDLLLECGFERVDCYWEDADEDGEGTGVFRKRNSAENEDVWIAYLVAWAGEG